MIKLLLSVFVLFIRKLWMMLTNPRGFREIRVERSEK